MNTKEILLVDDMLDLAKIMANVLEEEGRNFHFAQDGIYALEILKNNKIDLVISDIRMPRMDGIQLLKTIKDEKEFYNDPKILMMSGYTEYSSKELKELGAMDLLLKPVDLSTLTALIDNILS